MGTDAFKYRFPVAKLYTSVAYCVIFDIKIEVDSCPKKHGLGGKKLLDHHQQPARWKESDRDS